MPPRTAAAQPARPSASRAASGLRRLTLKHRVTLALVALVALFTLLQGGLAVLSLHEQEDELVDELVATEARRLAARLEAVGPALLGGGGSLVLSEHYSAWWQGPDGRSLPAPVPLHLAGLGDGPHRDESGASELHVMVLPAAGGRLFLQFDAEQNEAKVREFGWQVLLLALAFLVLATWLARHLADLLVAPLGRVTRLLDHWAPGAAASAASADEEHRLLDAFARVQARWERGLARENQSLANLRHEVRTPLTALRTDLEMLLLAWPADADVSGADATTPPPAAAQRARLQRALTSVDAVASALQTVRNLDAGQAAAPQQVGLADCVADAWASLGDLPAERGLVLDNRVPADAQGRLDRHALLTILRNLMRNAAEHAAPACCRVAPTPDGLLVQDDGPGVPADELPFVFERYYRGRRADTPATPSAPPTPDAHSPEDRGLGLAIARQVAQMQGWRLTATAVSPHGLCIRLDFSGPADVDRHDVRNDDHNDGR